MESSQLRENSEFFHSHGTILPPRVLARIARWQESFVNFLRQGQGNLTVDQGKVGEFLCPDGW